MTLSMFSTSREYIRIPVSADHDLSADVVQLAFTAGVADPADDQWVNAVWDDGAARLLVGPTAHELPAGAYTVWVKVTDLPEAPVLQAGRLIII